MYNYSNNEKNQKNDNVLKIKKGIFPWYCYVHLPLYILKSRINKFYNKNIFDQYLKITIIKNPFILLIDFFWFYTDFISKGYSKEGDIIFNKKVNSNNIFFYKSKKKKDNKWENIKTMFNNWITSGILEKQQTSKWEYLNELFYYLKNKENNIDFYIRNEYLNEDINKLCNLLKIPTFKINKKKTSHNIFKDKKIKDYYIEDSIKYIKKTFEFTINIGKYKLDENILYINT